MRNLQKLLMVIFAIAMTASVCAQTKWEGKWNAKNAELTAEFYIFSDHLAYVEAHVLESNSNGNVSLKTKAEWFFWGKWTDENNSLNIEITRQGSDVEILSSRGISEWEKEVFIEGVKSGFENVDDISYSASSRSLIVYNDEGSMTLTKGLTMTKVNTSMPYYYEPPKTGEFQEIDGNDLPSFYFTRGAYTAPNGDFQIGLFLRSGSPINEAPVLTKKYNANGEYIASVDEDLLNTHNASIEWAIIDSVAEILKAPAIGSAEYTFPDGRQYSGMWADHFPHGQGTMRYPNGDIMEGTWNHGEFVEGTATFTNKNGSYKGGFKNDACEGQGRFDYNNGDYSEGLWQNGQFIKGTVLKTLSGGVYLGGWNTKASGQGKFTYNDGSWEEGIFDGQNLVSGNVYIKKDDGSTYVGEVKNNKRDGNGTFTKGDYVLTGTWANDTIQQGKLTGPESTYEGTFANGKFVEGTYTYRSLVLTGTWNDQVFSKGDFSISLGGDNVIKSAQGRYEEMLDGMQRYKGIVEATMTVNAMKISGAYRNGMREWTITYPNNDQYVGYYSDADCCTSEIEKEFRYTWADGTSATGMVDKKHKPGKLSYKNAAGEPIKGKATKPYEMQLPGDGKTVNLPSGISDSWKNIIQLIEQQRPTVEIGTLYK